MAMGDRYATKRHMKCEVCFTIWDRGPNFDRHDVGTMPAPCTGCGRDPGANTPDSCAGCASYDAALAVFLDQFGFVIHLCVSCHERRSFFKRARAAKTSDPGLGVAGAKETIVRTISKRRLVNGTWVAVPVDEDPKPEVAINGDHGGTWTPGYPVYVKLPVRAPWAKTFDLKTLALAIFVTDPRVQEIINRVTDTKPPRFSKKARMAREKEEHPLFVWESDKALGPAELAKAIESIGANSIGHIMPADQGKLEILGPTNTPRQRRHRAAVLAWENLHGGRVERAARHDAIRRAIAIARAFPR